MRYSPSRACPEWGDKFSTITLGILLEMSSFRTKYSLFSKDCPGSFYSIPQPESGHGTGAVFPQMAPRDSRENRRAVLPARSRSEFPMLRLPGRSLCNPRTPSGRNGWRQRQDSQSPFHRTIVPGEGIPSPYGHLPGRHRIRENFRQDIFQFNQIP